jgi:molybdopterin-containing oxidoreductase family iron-sulfur binding subunit
VPSRRDFLTLMGALGLTGLGGCIRMPEERLAPYARRPVGRSPGVPVKYTTAMELGGVAQGLLVTCVDGRPVKIEGNPLHPLNQGATDAIAQASILDLYDPDRSRGVVRRVNGERIESSWEEFAKWAKDVFKGDGDGIAILSGASSSPSLAGMKELLTDKLLPFAAQFTYEAVSHEAEVWPLIDVVAGPPRAVLEPSRADVIVALDADLFGGGGPLAIKYARDFAARRGRPTAMSRLYVVEPALTVTGACADHRRPLRASLIPALAKKLASALGLAVGACDDVGGGVDAVFLQHLKNDLEASRGRSIVVAGPGQPLEVRALTWFINSKLGNLGKTILYYPWPDHPLPRYTTELALLADRMHSGEFKVLLILGGNPVCNAPADLEFAAALAKVPASVHLSPYENETSRACQWHLPQAHFLEAWGDARTCDGTVSIVQPLIEPLFDGRSAIEVLAMIAGDPAGTAGGGYDIVRRALRSLLDKPLSDFKWKKALADGIVEGTAWEPEEPEPMEPDELKSLLSTFPADKIDRRPRAAEDCEVVFFPDAKVYDGRFANNGWLQEMPDPITRLTWDNAALINPATAKRLGVQSDDVVALEAGGVEVKVPVLVLPGVADGVVGLALGYGRTAAGSIGNGVGQNAYALRTSDSMGWRSGVKVRPTGEKQKLATVQDHHVIDRVGKEAIRVRVPELIREVTCNESSQTVAADEHPRAGGDVPRADIHPRLGAETRAARSIFNEHRMDGGVAGQADQSQVPAHDRHRWGMAIDLAACVGCGACVVACQAENNIPIVGKEQVLLGREMHWIRVDRYFVDQYPSPPTPLPQGERGERQPSSPAPLPEGEGDRVAATARSFHQPVTCMQCENAPCEEVCPFGATTHSQEGLNMMTYNRCVGTRYCSNNCPYKVRRFNFFDYNCGTPKDLYIPNLLRQPLSELQRMQKNPEVTVRMRGVMEKCTYCIQRIEAARIAAKREGDRPIRDGEIQTACQQVCPARAIVFGDLNDPHSRVSQLHASPRCYALLDEELHTKPRTRYLARVRNPAPGLDG